MAKEAAKKSETKLTEEQKRKRADGYLKALDAGKRHYKKADALLEELLEGGMKPGDEVEIGGGRKAKLLDNFAEKNSHYKTVRVGRYSLEMGFVD